MCSVTKATPIQFINGKSHVKKRRGHKTALSGYYTYLSHDLLLMSSGVDTHTYTSTFMDEMISRNQAHAGLWLAHAWFKKYENVPSHETRCFLEDFLFLA